MLTSSVALTTASHRAALGTHVREVTSRLVLSSRVTGASTPPPCVFPTVSESLEPDFGSSPSPRTPQVHDLPKITKSWTVV